MIEIVIRNTQKDPNYAPYCIRCKGLIRMVKLLPFHWRCKCGAACDLRALVAAGEKLKQCTLGVLKDRAFGDSELIWLDDNGDEVGSGYIGNSGQTIIVEGNTFVGEDTHYLREQYKSRVIELNE